MKSTRRARRARTLAATAVLLVAGAGPAVVDADAAVLPPSLAVDTGFAPPAGIARYDFFPGNSAPETPAGVAVFGDRTYSVGETRGTDGNVNIAVVARRVDGSLDTGFAGDGTLSLAIAAGIGLDSANGIAVLPDGRLRIAGTTDADPATNVENLDAVIVGLLPDGNVDPAFGADPDNDGVRTGVASVEAVGGNGNQGRLADLAIDPASGRIAVTGARSDGGQDDLFVALTEADGTPVTGFGTGGFRIIDRNAAQLDDRGVDVEWRPGGGGVIVLAEADTNARITAAGTYAILRAFREDGTEDAGFGGDGGAIATVPGEELLTPGTPDTLPSSMIAHNGRIYVTGRTRPAAGTDTDAFLARVDADGRGQQSRRFDLRGQVVSTADAPLSDGLDLAVVPGVPDTLVVVGSTTYSLSGDQRIDWAAGAFNGFEGDLAAAGFGDLVLDTPNRENRLTAIAAAGAGTAIASGSLDAEPSGNSVIQDKSFGTLKLLVDNEKRCDLRLRLTAPLEIVFRGSAAATASFEIANVGTRSCAGTIDVPAPFAATYRGVAGPITSGLLTPGDTFAAPDVSLAYSGPRPAQRASLKASVTPVGDPDADTTNNAVEATVSFSYCDVGLARDGQTTEIPNEGARDVTFGARNRGTASCRGIRLAVSGATSLTERFAAFNLLAGRGATSALSLRAPKAKPGRTVSYTVRASSTDEDIAPASNTLTVRSRVVGVGDTTLRSAGVRRFSGRATGGRKGATKRSTRLRRVQVAIQSLKGKRCAFVPTAGGRPVRSPGTRKQGCAEPTWISAKGTKRWSLRLKKRLPAGRYLVRSRAVTANGFTEAKWGAKDGNRKVLRVGRKAKRR